MAKKLLSTGLVKIWFKFTRFHYFLLLMLHTQSLRWRTDDQGRRSSCVHLKAAICQWQFVSQSVIRGIHSADSMVVRLQSWEARVETATMTSHHTSHTSHHTSHHDEANVDSCRWCTGKWHWEMDRITAHPPSSNLSNFFSGCYHCPLIRNCSSDEMSP